MLDILLFSEQKPVWVISCSSGRLRARAVDQPWQTLHDNEISAFDADIDAEGTVHIIAYSSAGLLIYYTLSQKGNHVVTLSALRPETERLENLQILAKQQVHILYTVSNAPFLTQTLVCYRKGDTWSGTRVMQFPPNAKHLTVLAEDGEQLDLFCAYSVLSEWTLKQVSLSSEENKRSERILYSGHSAVTDLNICAGHYAYCQDGAVYCDRAKLTHRGKRPILLINEYLHCLTEEDGQHRLYRQEQRTWSPIALSSLTPLYRVRGEIGFQCTCIPAHSIEEYRSPLSEPAQNTASSPPPIRHFESRIRKLEELFLSYSKALNSTQSQVRQLSAQVEKLRSSRR